MADRRSTNTQTAEQEPRSTRGQVIKEDVLEGTCGNTQPDPHDMDPKHLLLYKKPVDEEMALPRTGMIDLTGAGPCTKPCSKCPATLNTSVGETTASILDLVDPAC